eukprot:1693196-Pleurochrysis_carterae.AAC.2
MQRSASPATSYVCPASRADAASLIKRVRTVCRLVHLPFGGRVVFHRLVCKLVRFGMAASRTGWHRLPRARRGDNQAEGGGRGAAFRHSAKRHVARCR